MVWSNTELAHSSLAKLKIMTIATFYIKTKYCSFLGGLRTRDEIIIRHDCVLYMGFRFSVYYQLSQSLQLLKSYSVEANQTFYICSKDSGFTRIKVLSVPKATSSTTEEITVPPEELLYDQFIDRHPWMSKERMNPNSPYLNPLKRLLRNVAVSICHKVRIVFNYLNYVGFNSSATWVQNVI